MNQGRIQETSNNPQTSWSSGDGSFLADPGQGTPFGTLQMKEINDGKL